MKIYGNIIQNKKLSENKESHKEIMCRERYQDEKSEFDTATVSAD